MIRLPKIKQSSAQKKVQAIVRKAFGVRAESLLFSCPSFENKTKAKRVFSAKVMAKWNRHLEGKSKVEKAFQSRLGKEKADELSFHSWDWRENAAFIVALQLFPEKFTAREIRDAIESLAAHAPYHVGGMAELLGYETKPPSAYDAPEPKVTQR